MYPWMEKLEFVAINQFLSKIILSTFCTKLKIDMLEFMTGLPKDDTFKIT